MSDSNGGAARKSRSLNKREGWSWATAGLVLNLACGISLPILAIASPLVGTCVCVVTWVLSALFTVLRASDYFRRRWPFILMAALILYCTTPKDPSYLPMLATFAGVIPLAIIITWKEFGLDKMWRGASLASPDTRAGLMAYVEEGRGSTDTSNFRIGSDSEDDPSLSDGSSSRNMPVGNRYTRNAHAAGRDRTPGAAHAL